MITAIHPGVSKARNSFCQILGVKFFTGNASEAVDRMSHGGLLVVPSAPVLKDLTWNHKCREALLNADLAITDSAFMVLIWNWIDADRIRRLSGLSYLREFLSRPDLRAPGATFWIMASVESARRNTAWLRSRGLMLTPDDIYIAPMYTGEITDLELLESLRERRPRHIIVAIGGGTQERLGFYLKRNVSFSPAIHCIGAAIAFLSGDQVRIPEWADHLYLGWLFRCFEDPRRYVARYWAARKLLPLMLRYRREPPSPDVSGRDFYAAHYTNDLERQAKWLEYGAFEKANSVSYLLEKNGIKLRTMLELGCGTGAVIVECARRGLASEFTAVDYSEEAIEYLKSQAPAINCVTADITDAGFILKDRFDVIVLSHVIEHLEEPLEFLKQIKERFRFRYLIVEVPLEDLLMPRVKHSFRDRKQNVAGHVQFFTGSALDTLLRSAGFEIVDRRRYVPKMSPESIRFACETNGDSRLRTAYKLCTACYLPKFLGSIWKQLWYAHAAVLCSAGDVSELA